MSQDERDAVHSFPRVAALPDGRSVERAFFYPEYTMPRLFHREAGVTLARDRHVHERFILPANAKLVRHRESLLHTWPEPTIFRKKLEHYVSMEYAEWTGSWQARLRWVIWYNLRSAMGQLARAVWCWTIGTLSGEVVLPWSYTWPMIAYRFRAIKQGMRSHK